MGRPNRAARAAIAQRRADAIDLELAGVDWLTIGLKLAAASAINSDGTAPGVWHRQVQTRPDKRLIELACKDVSKALTERMTALDNSADGLPTPCWPTTGEGCPVQEFRVRRGIGFEHL
jgi:hypothetical protein